MRKIFFVLATLAFVLFAFTSLDTFVLTGKVVDKDLSPIPFASITIDGSRTGVSADATGTFTIRVKQNDALLVSGTGFNPIKIKVTDQKIITVVLERSEIFFNDVRVTPAFKTKRVVKVNQTIKQTNVTNVPGIITIPHFQTQQKDSVSALNRSATPAKKALPTDSIK